MSADKNVIHICNDGTPRSKGVASQIRSEDEFENHVSAPNSVYLLNINLNWDSRKLGGDCGFDVANALRTKKKALAPIIFYSYIPVRYFEFKAETSLKYKLLFGRASAFLPAPFTEKELDNVIKETPPLTDASLDDVVTTLADLKGLVIEKFNHDLKFGRDIASVFSEAESFLTNIEKAAIEIDRYKTLILEANEKHDRATFGATKQAFVSLCNAQLTEGGQASRNTRKAPYSILLVEDDEEYRERACRHLNERFNRVHAVAHASQAIAKLEKDIANEILAVITDWRLYEDGTHTYWQQAAQGYEVLERAMRTGHRALFALTSQPDFLIHRIRNLMGVRFHLFKKQNFENAATENEQQWDIFADAVRNGCDEALLYASSTVKSKKWTNKVNGDSYSDLYFLARNEVDSKQFFPSVFKTADEVWEYVLEHERSRFANIKIVRNVFDLEIPKEQLDLSRVLVWRLIWFGLAIRFRDPRINNPTSGREDLTLAQRIYWVLYTGFRRYWEPDGSVNQEKNKLCFLDSDLMQHGVLPHERQWLQRQGLTP